MKAGKINLVSLSALILLATGTVCIAIDGDGSIISDEFNGTVLDTSKWTVYGTTGNVHAFVTVGEGKMMLESRFTELDKFIKSSGFNLGTATEWVVEMKFAVLSDMVPGSTPISTSNRQSILIGGATVASNLTKDFVISLLEGSTADKFTLGWGADILSPISAVVLSPAATDLSRNTDYTLVIHHRSDNEIDFYLDGVHIATRSSLTMDKAESLFIGDWSGSTALRMTADYIRVGNPVTGPQNCGDPGTVYLDVDFNHDCYVDMEDFAQFAREWMLCTDPADADCQ